MGLLQQPSQVILKVEPCLVQVLKKNAYSKPKVLPVDPEKILSFSVQDQQILHWLTFARKHAGQVLPPNMFPLQGNNGVILLQQLLETKRCFWIAANSPPLSLGEERKANLEWEAQPDGLQRLYCHIERGGTYTILPLTPPWYLDHVTHQCGSLDTGFEPAVAAALLAAPPLKPEQIEHFRKTLAKRVGGASKPMLPAQVVTGERTLTAEPIPHLRLFSSRVAVQLAYENAERTFEVQLPLAELTFQYDKAFVAFGDEEKTASYVADTDLIVLPREFDAEKKAVEHLCALGVDVLGKAAHLSLSDQKWRHYFLVAEEIDQQKLLDFSLNQLPLLRQSGWQIRIDADYPCHLIDEETAEWYSEIEEDRAHAWFDFSLGITVGGEKVNVLPLLIQIIETYFPNISPQAVAAMPDNTKLVARLPDGRFLPFPMKRIRNILQILTELYDSESLSRLQHLKLSTLRIGQVMSLEDLFPAAKFRWLGGERLRKLGEKLRHFKGVVEVPVPAGFQSELRPYQRDGLNWLQFLREYDLAGILADDMGLGKTVQALAHLLVEKQSGRMDKPSLIVAPTSLMVNWRMEAERFTPELKILVLHGAGRKPHFESIQDYDVILTTYPLLVRDEKFLTAQQYHIFILDEAQFIKNPKAKATRVVHRIDARHRLCLTGTPMENHLGELWSLFNFLLPGLLGTAKKFQQLFRGPIEKSQDEERRVSLAERVAPFLLRRTKQEVLRELPDKINIMRGIELEDIQRDLYESIRVSMHDKISQLIQDRGLLNSRVAILDALLKLRQICCDPRLLKLTSAKKLEAGSAKLTLLMDMVPSLIEEGRRILLFSQFTEMIALIEMKLQESSIGYVKLTGQTKDRATPIQQFQAREVPLFLISLKAGGTGLNLTAADTVIHYDPWWNPAVEVQATDRAHRIGQEKTVFVYKLITVGTVEEKIMMLQEKKRALLEGLFTEQAEGKLNITQEDLEDLFA